MPATRFTLESTSPIGVLMPTSGEPIELVGTCEVDFDAIFAVLIHNPTVGDIEALPTIAIEKCQAIVDVTDEVVAALAQRDDINRISVFGNVPTWVANWFPELGIQAHTESRLSAPGALALAHSASPLHQVAIGGAPLSDEDVAIFAERDGLQWLDITSDAVVGDVLQRCAGSDLTFIKLSGAQLRGDAISRAPVMEHVTVAYFAGPRISEGLDVAALRRALPNVTNLDIVGGAFSPGRADDETNDEFAALLPLRHAFAGVEVNGITLSRKGAERAAGKLGVSLESPHS